MSPRGDEPLQRGEGSSSGKSSVIEEKVAQFYYSHGLFCSTYSGVVVTVAIAVALICCLPLVNLPLPGNAPQQTWTSSANTTSGIQPFCYVQQVVLRAAVLPWESELALGDAFRAPLYEAFKLLEAVRNYEDSESSKTLGHVCLHVEATRHSKTIGDQNVLPQYSCLVLSPANLWHQDVQQFSQDSSLLTTIFNQHSFQKGKTSNTEMLFGMRIFDTGIKRYPLRNRQRVIQYAITLFLKEYDEQFMEGLRHKLRTIYPLHQNLNASRGDAPTVINDTLVIQYPGEINFAEFVPVTVAFVVLFVYCYFSIRKIEVIQSKLGMAAACTATVLGSLAMTLGLCFFFGLTLNHEGRFIFPYLVLLVGLENILVLIRSVVSTPLHLDVKIRIAQGLSKEGWSITKNLMLELTILTFGLFTFVPVIQEFCIFAIVGLLADYFMQMLFFSTILGIDIRRKENLVEKTFPNFRNSLYQSQAFYDKLSGTKSGMPRSRSHPRLSSFPTNVVAGQAHNAQDKKIPKRWKLVNIWTRTRFFHRSFMVIMVIWIGNIAYNSGLIEHYILNNNFLQQQNDQQNSSSEGGQHPQSYTSISLRPLLNTSSRGSSSSSSPLLKVNYVTHSPVDLRYHLKRHNYTDDLDKLRHPDYAPWMKLSPRHWLFIVKKYNLTLSGEHVVVLPSVKLSHVIRPEQAVLLRNPDEKYGERFQWQALAAALDPIDFNGMESPSGEAVPQSDQPFYPTSVFAMVLIGMLCLISVLVLGYIFFVFYRCICTRNYAEWRASWFSRPRAEENVEEQVMLEAVPVVLEGHRQEIECIATDGVSLVSSCLDGQLKVWDTNTGELWANIDRKSYFHSTSSVEDLNMERDEENSSDYESGSPPSRDEFFPKLKRRINTSFSSLKDVRPSAYDAKAEIRRAFFSLYVDSDAPRLRSRQRGQPRRIVVTKEVLNHARTASDLRSGSGLGREQLLGHEQNGVMGLDERCWDNGGDSSVDSAVNNGGGASSLEVNGHAEFDRSDSANGGHVTTVCGGSGRLSPVWCMDYVDNLVVIGCADGRLEFWEGTTGRLKCIFEDGTDVGVSNVKIVGSRVVAARLFGTLDMFHLQTYNHGRPIDWNFTCAYRRTHVRTGSVGSMTEHSNLMKQNEQDEDELRCLKVLSIKAHQQPITCLDCEGGRVLTGSQDHTLKVFRLEDGSPQYTLHGHCGPITCLFIDRVSPATSGSGSQDGMLCVWDLLTGACMYNIQAHDGTITSLTYSASYVISLGTDDRLRVWERFQGHLLNTIYVPQTFSSQVLMLAPHLVITARGGGLVIWDVRSGECVRTIALGRSPFVFIKQLVLLRDAVLCDYGNQLRIVRFPLITHKFD